ncbi:MAG: MFS transporter [Candidatus Dormibacteraceae bacterium]
MRVLALSCVAVFLVAIDSQALVLALAAIGREFGAPLSGLTDLGVYIQLGAIAGLGLGLLSDRLGRRRVLILSVAGFSLVNVASAAAPNLVVLSALRVVAVCLETGAGATATALVIEELPAPSRAFGISLLTIAGGAGAGVATVLWPFIAPNWRILYLLGAVGLVGAGVLHLWLRESAAWVATGGHARLALRVLLQPQWRWRLLVAVVTGLLGAVLYVPANLFYAVRGDDLGMSQFEVSAVIVVGAVASIPAFFVGAALADRWGRRRLAIGLGIVTALFTAVAFSGGVSTYWVGNIAWTVLASASSPVTGTWFGELFPTRARATSGSASAVAGAVGGAVGLELLNGVGTAHGLGVAVALCAVAAVAGSILLVLLPETLGRPLSE